MIKIKIFVLKVKNVLKGKYMIIIKKNVFLKINQIKSVLQMKNIVQNTKDVFQNVKKVKNIIQRQINV